MGIIYSNHSPSCPVSISSFVFSCPPIQLPGLLSSSFSVTNAFVNAHLFTRQQGRQQGTRVSRMHKFSLNYLFFFSIFSISQKICLQRLRNRRCLYNRLLHGPLLATVNLDVNRRHLLPLFATHDHLSPLRLRLAHEFTQTKVSPIIVQAGNRISRIAMMIAMTAMMVPVTLLLVSMGSNWPRHRHESNTRQVWHEVY